MTKAEFVAHINKRTGIDRKYVLMMVEAIMEAIKDHMSNGENIYLRHFGTFGIVTRREKIGRNIGKGTSIVIPEHKTPHFKPSKDFVEMIKQ